MTVSWRPGCALAAGLRPAPWSHRLPWSLGPLAVGAKREFSQEFDSKLTHKGILVRGLLLLAHMTRARTSPGA